MNKRQAKRKSSNYSAAKRHAAAVTANNVAPTISPQKISINEYHLISFFLGVIVCLLATKYIPPHPSNDKNHINIAAASENNKEISTTVEAKIPVVVKDDATNTIKIKSSDVQFVPVPSLPVLPAPKKGKILESQSTLEKGGGVSIDLKNTSSKKKDDEDSSSGGVHVVLGNLTKKDEATPKTDNLKSLPQAKDILDPSFSAPKNKPTLVQEKRPNKIEEIK